MIRCHSWIIKCRSSVFLSQILYYNTVRRRARELSPRNLFVCTVHCLLHNITGSFWAEVSLFFPFFLLSQFEYLHYRNRIIFDPFQFTFLKPIRHRMSKLNPSTVFTSVDLGRVDSFRFNFHIFMLSSWCSAINENLGLLEMRRIGRHTVKYSKMVEIPHAVKPLKIVISASPDGCPRSRVRGTLRSAPHRH